MPSMGSFVFMYKSSRSLSGATVQRPRLAFSDQDQNTVFDSLTVDKAHSSSESDASLRTMVTESFVLTRAYRNIRWQVGVLGVWAHPHYTLSL